METLAPCRRMDFRAVPNWSACEPSSRVPTIAWQYIFPCNRMRRLQPAVLESRRFLQCIPRIAKIIASLSAEKIYSDVLTFLFANRTMRGWRFARVELYAACGANKIFHFFHLLLPVSFGSGVWGYCPR